ncbi:MAG: triple tyrosine motif-containing protein [Bacteroidetes bacterium]|jgi:ligand-binding sensor domain-containing protein|nr:triple tyrosine motif-containing protein [Bacteroidota bacterium]
MEKGTQKIELVFETYQQYFGCMLSHKRLLLMLIVLFSIFEVKAQNAESTLYFDRILSENVRIEKGLSQNTLNTMIQDSDGFMWFGTWDGLNRYDGYDFLIFNKEHGLTNENIRAIYQKNDTLWIGTEEGLNLLEMSTNRITNFLSDEHDTTSLTNNWINHIYEDHNGTIWISTASGLSSYKPKTNTFGQVFSRDYGNPLRSNHMNMVKQDSSNNYWIATSYGLVYYEIDTQSLTRYFHIDADTTSLPDNHVNSITFDIYNRLWVGTQSGLALFDYEKKSFSNIKPTSVQSFDRVVEVMSLLADGESGLWIGTNGQGLFYMDFETGVLNNYTNEPNRSYSLSDNRIHSIYNDYNGNVWVGTFNGLNMLNKDAPKFRTYRHNPHYENSLANNSVWAFLEVEPGVFWIGTDAGISIFNKKKNTYSVIKADSKKENSLVGNLVRSLYMSDEGMIWIGTRNKGLSAYNPTTRRFTNYKSDPKVPGTLPHDYITDIEQDALGRLWVSTDNGFGVLEQETGFFINFSDKVSSLSYRVYDVFLDSKKRLWLASAHGLLQYNYETDSFITYLIPEEMLLRDELLTNKFFSITEDQKGLFWIGTRGGGLAQFDPEAAIFKVYTEKDGLANNITYKALQDGNGIFWITTNWGLSRFNPDEISFSNYDVTDRIQSNEFNLNAAIISSDGEIFIGGMNGFNAFYPEDIVINTVPPPVRITAFKKFNELQLRNLRDGDTLFLKYDDNYFAFEFAALDFTNPQKNKYRYILENYNNSWVDRNANQRFAEYAQVSPGTYRFHLIASNSDGYWNTKGTSLMIIIEPAWFDTWWFRGAIALLIVFMVYSLIFIRMRNIRRKHEVEKNTWLSKRKCISLSRKHFSFR